MPIILAVIGAIGAVIYWSMRARHAADAGRELLDVAQDVKAAARRFGFKRNTARHPVEDIEDPNIAIAGIAVSFLELDDYPAQEQRHAMLRALQNELRINLTAAEELTVLGRWMMTECNGPDAAIPRLSRKLHKIGGPGEITPLMEILKSILAASDGDLNKKQRDALDDVKRAFKL
ncbi:hypothetical protein [Litoreibacter roseus]|uniref:Tellurite resistance protein TerB n=1 Tax=Litoreibacter roseus TaxID=2601869 RepID=A0A6N6JDV8_9RHOB|nr:hypothetical protein [Litoreibacter roseus]GFE63579.1 hypothetical protein KIN_06530 [Litoreibacter roseus]